MRAENSYAWTALERKRRKMLQQHTNCLPWNLKNSTLHLGCPFLKTFDQHHNKTHFIVTHQSIIFILIFIEIEIQNYYTEQVAGMWCRKKKLGVKVVNRRLRYDIFEFALVLRVHSFLKINIDQSHTWISMLPWGCKGEKGGMCLNKIFLELMQ